MFEKIGAGSGSSALRRILECLTYSEMGTVTPTNLLVGSKASKASADSRMTLAAGELQDDMTKNRADAEVWTSLHVVDGLAIGLDMPTR